jgi:hypothetical protein
MYLEDKDYREIAETLGMKWMLEWKWTG